MKVKGTIAENTMTLIPNLEHKNFTETDTIVPKGTMVALQGNDMIHDDHVVVSTTLEEFAEEYPLTETLFAGQKTFTYPDWSFVRFMVIGIK